MQASATAVTLRAASDQAAPVLKFFIKESVNAALTRVLAASSASHGAEFRRIPGRMADQEDRQGLPDLVAELNQILPRNP
jgi:hypothetical protein